MRRRPAQLHPVRVVRHERALGVHPEREAAGARRAEGRAQHLRAVHAAHDDRAPDQHAATSTPARRAADASGARKAFDDLFKYGAGASPRLCLRQLHNQEMVPLLSPADQDKLREAFAEMTSPVRLLFFTQTLGCETCLQTRQILDELPPLSDKITIEEVNFVLDKDRAAQYGIDRVAGDRGRRRGRSGRRRATRASASSARRPATNSSRSCRRCCSSAAAASRLTDEQRQRARRGRQAGDDAGVHDADVTALSAGGQPRARNGLRESEHHGGCRGSDGVPRSRARATASAACRRPSSTRRLRFSARCRRTMFIEQALAGRRRRHSAGSARLAAGPRRSSQNAGRRRPRDERHPLGAREAAGHAAGSPSSA